MYKPSALACLFFSLISCPCRSDEKPGTKETVPDVVLVAEDDKEMNLAMQKARKSADNFVKAFQNRKKGQSDFGVKVAIRDGESVEHFWVGVAKWDGKQFSGTISNEPQLVDNVKEGDKISVAKDKIGDWMYVENKKLVGGYTVRVLRNRLSPAERKALDESIPYSIE